MRLGIDASNIRGGGGVTHLVELLRTAKPQDHGFEQVIVWAGSATLNGIKNRPWLQKASDPLLDRTLPYRVYWQRFKLAGLAKAAECNVLFVPGGSDASGFRPLVTMSRNMLPFEWQEMRRYGVSWMFLRLMLLRWSQSRSFRRADGLIFLTQYARDGVMKVVNEISGKSAIVPHGIGNRFSRPPRLQLEIDQYSHERPFRILYVSIVDVYKHQWQVAEAVARLRASGLPVMLDLVGPAYGPALRRLQQTLHQIDRSGEFIRYLGDVPHGELHKLYENADINVFASSCENMPNILLEGMASGLPIACSKKGPMPEVLSDAGVYFDPERPDEIAAALQSLIESPTLRADKAQAAFRRAQAFSWHRCADETFRLLADICWGNNTQTNSLAQDHKV